MTTYAKIRTGALILDPVAPASVTEDNAIFSDSSNGNQFSFQAGGVVATQAMYRKVMQSGFAGTIPLNTPVSKEPDGRILPADANDPNAGEIVGITLETFSAENVLGAVHLFGPNVTNAVSGLGFVPGQEIYLSTVAGGYTNDPSTLNDISVDSIIRIGIADCAQGTASGTATDLIMLAQIISRPN